MLVGDGRAAEYSTVQPPPSAGLCLFLFLSLLSVFLIQCLALLAAFLLVPLFLTLCLCSRLCFLTCACSSSMSHQSSSEPLSSGPQSHRPLPRIDVVLPWISLPPPRFTLIEACRAQPPNRKPACKPPEAPVPVLLSCLCAGAVSVIISPPSSGPPLPITANHR